MKSVDVPLAQMFDSKEGVQMSHSVDSDKGRAMPAIDAPNPEVSEKKPRRKFTAAYKLRILQQADACRDQGQIGALLRGEGLYSSNLTLWRKQRREGALAAMEPKKRDAKAKGKNPLAARVAELERQNRLLEAKLRKAEIVIEAQKKISEILNLDRTLDEENRR